LEKKNQTAYLVKSLKRLVEEGGSENYIILGLRSKNIFIEIYGKYGVPEIYCEVVANEKSIKKYKLMLSLGFRLPGQDVSDLSEFDDELEEKNFFANFFIQCIEDYKRIANLIFFIFYEIFELDASTIFDFKIILSKFD